MAGDDIDTEAIGSDDGLQGIGEVSRLEIEDSIPRWQCS